MSVEHVMMGEGLWLSVEHVMMGGGSMDIS